MKITPLEIRQKQFDRKFRGYDVEEVQAFITSLSQEWERVMDDNKELRLRFESAEREVQKLREVETTLFRTLKTAEDTGNNMIEQANKQASLLLRETQMKADAILIEAKNQAKTIIEEAEDQAKSIVTGARDDLKNLTIEYREVENKRDNILQELKNIVGDISERLERYNRNNKIELFNKYDEKPLKEENKEVLKESEQKVINSIKTDVLETEPITKSSEAVMPEVASIEDKSFETKMPLEEVEKEKLAEVIPKSNKRSFFDEIE